MKRLDVGVVGCGTAGPAAALLLARRGHAVTLYERVAAPRAVGAGIIVQPTGQAVLNELGLLPDVLARGHRLDRLRVENTDGRTLLELSYASAGPSYFGIGLHRGVLFDALYQAVLAEPGITVKLGVTGESLARADGQRFALRDAEGNVHAPHDLIVAADGARSRFRDDTGIARSAEPYPWGALWFVARDLGQRFEHQLYQVVNGTHRMLGLLPTGFGPDRPDGSRAKVPLVSLYWSIRADRVDEWRLRGFSPWKDEIAAMVPDAEPILDQIEDPDQVLFSSYFDVVMQPWNTRAVVHLGDAAHAMSPQLGQGANLALWDAWVLAQCLDEEREALTCALDRYSRRRADHLGYYQFATRWLTPFFQSDHQVLAAARDALMPLFNRVELFNRAMVMGMCGTADGHPWRRLAGV